MFRFRCPFRNFLCDLRISEWTNSFKLIRFGIETGWKLRIRTHSAYGVMKINDIDIVVVVVVVVCVEVCSFFAKLVQWVRYSSNRNDLIPPKTHPFIMHWQNISNFIDLPTFRESTKIHPATLDQYCESGGSISILNHKYVLSRKREEIQWNKVNWCIYEIPNMRRTKTVSSLSWCDEFILPSVKRAACERIASKTGSWFMLWIGCTHTARSTLCIIDAHSSWWLLLSWILILVERWRKKKLHKISILHKSIIWIAKMLSICRDCVPTVAHFYPVTAIVISMLNNENSPHQLLSHSLTTFSPHCFLPFATAPPANPSRQTMTKIIPRSYAKIIIKYFV